MLVAWILIVGRTLDKIVLFGYFSVSLPIQHYSQKPYKFAWNEVITTLWNVPARQFFRNVKASDDNTFGSLRIVLAVSQSTSNRYLVQLFSSLFLKSAYPHSCVLSSFCIHCTIPPHQLAEKRTSTCMNSFDPSLSKTHLFYSSETVAKNLKDSEIPVSFLQ